jgi:membrane protein
MPCPVAESSAPAAGEPRLSRAVRRTGQLIEHGVSGFFRDGCTQRAAAISFFALFSIFPIAILCVAVLGLAFNDVAARREVVDFFLDRLPLTADEGRRQLERAMLRVTREVAGFGVLGVLTLIFAASNIMGSIRQALNAAFRVEDDRPPVQAKLWDLLMVLVFGVLVTLSLGLTLLDDVVGDVGGGFISMLQDVGNIISPFIALAVFAGVFRWVPAERRPLRDLWPGILVAALGYELAKRGFALYLQNFADYGAIYASLGSVVAFLVFTYITAFLALMGAEFAAEWRCVRAGEYDGPPGPPFHKQILGFIRGLFLR